MTAPSACRHCPVPEREQGLQHTEAAGLHPWTEPTDQQRLDRMRDRRDARTARSTR